MLWGRDELCGCSAHQASPEGPSALWLVFPSQFSLHPVCESSDLLSRAKVMISRLSWEFHVLQTLLGGGWLPQPQSSRANPRASLACVQRRPLPQKKASPGLGFREGREPPSHQLGASLHPPCCSRVGPEASSCGAGAAVVRGPQLGCQPLSPHTHCTRY